MLAFQRRADVFDFGSVDAGSHQRMVGSAAGVVVVAKSAVAFVLADQRIRRAGGVGNRRQNAGLVTHTSVTDGRAAGACHKCSAG